MKRIILLFLLCFSCQNNKEDFNLNLIPDNPLYFISIDSYDELNYNEISFIDDILDIDIANDSLLDSSSEISYSFHKIGKDNYGKLISFNNSKKIFSNKSKDSSLYENKKIYNLKLDELEYYYLNKNNKHIFSDNIILLENYIRNASFKSNSESKNFYRLLESKSENLSLLVSQNFKNLDFNGISINIGEISDWVNFEFDISNNEIAIIGTSIFDSKSNRIINLLRNNKPKKTNIIEIIPQRIESIKSISFDYNNFQNNLNNNFNNTQYNSELDSFYTNINELVYYNESGESVLIIDKIDEEILFDLKSKKEKVYRNFEIFKLDEQISDLSNLKEFDFIKDLKYYSVIESKLIFSSDTGPIEEIIFEYKSGNSLIYNEKFIEFNKSIPAKNSSYELFKINNPNEKMPFWFKTINVRDSINYVTFFSKTLSKESEKKIELIFNKSFDSKILSAPTLVNNYRTGNNNIIFQDENLDINLLDSDGNLLWKKKLDNSIISEIFQVDTYKNKRLQFLFATTNEIILMDIKGNIVYSLKFRENNNVKFLSKFDYDNNKNYRYLIVTENETRMIDSKFKTVKGFKAKHDKNISEPYKHIRVSNRDYIVGKNSNGKVSILNRRGDDRIKLPKDLTFSSHLYEYENGMVGLLSSNELIKIDLSGKISRDYSSNKENQINANKKTIVSSNDNKITINGLAYDLPFATYDNLSIFRTLNKSYYSIIDKENNKVYLYDDSGLIDGFPLFTSSSIDINEFGNKKFITFLGDSSELVLYSIN